ncbi:alginate lyase family protein [Algoriphagus sp.]|uniref:alginate lyase family protein n=1 Tax=Algoriphagus sp. TaxID=1872435 RepID=UPI003F72A66B
MFILLLYINLIYSSSITGSCDASRLFLINKDVLEELVYLRNSSEPNILNNLIKKADSVLLNDLYSVTFKKKKLAPSGDIHDYYSQSPYWYVNDSGKAYKKDGKRNPEIYDHKDRSQLLSLISDLKVLSLAYYLTQNSKYSLRCYQILNTWFIDSQTKMNPHLQFAQVKPTEHRGSFSGMIEARELIQIPDVLYLLDGAEAIKPEFLSSIRVWFSEFLSWLEFSELGVSASKQNNNIGTIYDLQLLVFDFFINNDIDHTREEIFERYNDRICSQIGPSGIQKFEMKRSSPISYSLFNLKMLSIMVVFSKNVNGEDLLDYNCNGVGLNDAFQYLLELDNSSRSMGSNKKLLFSQDQELYLNELDYVINSNFSSVTDEKTSTEIEDLINRVFIL